MKNKTTIMIDTTAYEASHGKRPRGDGSWAFGATRTTDLDQLIWCTTFYGEAVKAVKMMAPEGTTVLYLYP